MNASTCLILDSDFQYRRGSKQTTKEWRHTGEKHHLSNAGAGYGLSILHQDEYKCFVCMAIESTFKNAWNPSAFLSYFGKYSSLLKNFAFSPQFEQDKHT